MECPAVNVITSTDARALMSAMTPTMVGLEELRDDVRVAHWALAMARLELPVVWQYRGDDAISFRRELARRIIVPALIVLNPEARKGSICACECWV